MLTRLRMPGAARSIVARVRASAGFALIGAIVAKYDGAQEGLGAVITQHVRGIHAPPADTLFGLVVVCSLLGVLVTWGASALTRLALLHWLVNEAVALPVLATTPNSRS